MQSLNRPPEKHLPALERRYRALVRQTGHRKPRDLDPAVIADEFDAAVVEYKARFTGSGPFYPGTGRRGLAGLRGGADTRSLAARLAERPRFKVGRRPELDFRYVDREIMPSRALKSGGTATYQDGPQVKLDLLLANAEDATPIVCELKIEYDKDPEAALIQALLYASLLAPDKQRQRLRLAYPDLFGDAPPERLDVYVMLYRLPPELKDLCRSATELAAGLKNDDRIAGHLRRIAFIEAYDRAGVIRFRALAPPIELTGAHV